MKEKELGAQGATEDVSAGSIAPDAASHAAPKFTPGPWNLVGKDESNFNITQTSHLTRDVWFIPRNAADWHLIAAAPEMYEALKAAQGYMRNGVLDLQGRTPKQTAINTLNGGIKAIDAALAKAEGR